MMKKLIWLLALVMWLPGSVWAQGLPVKDGIVSTLATVSGCGGAENCVKSNGPALNSSAGFQAITGTTGAGVSSNNKRSTPAYVAESKGIQVAQHNILFEDTFNALTQNTSVYRYAITTMTMTQAGGFLNTNGLLVNTLNTNTSLQTFRTFPLFTRGELRLNFSAQKTIASQTNETIEIGLMTATLPGAAVPTDGCFFRYNTAAELRGVCSINSTETQTAAMTQPSVAVVHDYQMVVNGNVILFYIDESLLGTITMLSDIPGFGQPSLQATVPFTIRHYIGASIPALTTQQLKVSNVVILGVGPNLNRPWERSRAGSGLMASQGQNGGTMGTTANTLNGATPAAAALTNTAISTGSPVGLGGVAHVLPTLAAGTDGILFSFQNPTGGVNQTPRNLVITGVVLSGGVDVALTGGPLVYVYSLAYGHTAISLATAETGSFVSPTTKAPRRIWLGVHTAVVTAAAGTALGPGSITIDFPSSIVVAPGEFVAITVRNQGTVTSAGSVVIACAILSHQE